MSDFTNLHSRLQDLRDDWSRLPVWGPDETGLHILDGVDLEGLLSELDRVLDGKPHRLTQEELDALPRSKRGRARG